MNGICPHCNAELQVGDEFLGLSVTCSLCKGTFSVPKVLPTPVPDEPAGYLPTFKALSQAAIVGIGGLLLAGAFFFVPFVIYGDAKGDEVPKWAIDLAVYGPLGTLISALSTAAGICTADVRRQYKRDHGINE